MTIEAWPASLQAWTRARSSLGGGVSTGLRASMKPHPIFFTGGSGPELTDVDGNTYLDYVLGWGPVILGHGHPALVAAVGDQLARGATYGSGHHFEYEVAEAVLAAIPLTERVLWANTGSEAVQVALRLARAHTGRQRFVKFVGHYHGWTDPVLVGYRPDEHGALDAPGTRGQSRSAVQDVWLARWGDPDSVAEILKSPGSDVAAVFVEPVLCNSGVIEAPPGYLAELRALCDASGAVLIFDEVITGFRIAYGGAVERYGVHPDLVVLGKAIAGGFSLAAVAGRADLIDQTEDGVVHAGTYNGNPIVLAAAAATLAELRAPGVYDRLEAAGAALATGMRESVARHGVTAAINQVGPIVQCLPAVEQAHDFESFLAADQTFYDALSVQLLRRGVFTLPGGRWYLSTAHTQQNVADTVAAFDASLAAVRAESKTLE